MKRNFKINLFCSVLLMLAALTGNGCKNEKSSSEPQDYHIKSPENILTQYNTGRPEWDMSNRAIGTVKIEVKDSVVIINFIPQFETEIHLYFLQVNSRAKEVDAGMIEKAEVFYMDRHLLVNSLVSKKTYLFSVMTDPIPDYLKGIEGVTNVSGYGLGIRKFAIGVEGIEVPTCNCVPSGYPMGNCQTTELNAVNCVTANGAGSCKVTCGGQYFACCDMKGIISH